MIPLLFLAQPFLAMMFLACSQPYYGVDTVNKVIHVCSIHTDPVQEKQEDPSYNVAAPGLFLSQGTNQNLALAYWVNQSRGVNVSGEHYTFRLTKINLGTTAQKVRTRTEQALNGTFGECFIFFGPFSSGWTAITAPMIENANAVAIMPLAAASDIFECGDTMAKVNARPPCTQTFTRRYQRSWGLIPPAERFWDNIILGLRLKGARTFAVWASDEPFSQSVVAGILETCDSVGMTVLDVWKTPDVPLDDGNITAIVRRAGGTGRPSLDTRNPDIIALIPRIDQSCAPLIQELKRQNVVAKAFFLSQCVDKQTVLNATGDDSRYFFDYATWDSRVRGTEFIDDYYFKTNASSTETASQLWQASYTAFNGVPPDVVIAPSTFIQGVVLEEALRRANSFNLDTLNSFFPLLTMRTLYGKVNFNVYGMDEIKGMVHIQRGVDRALEIVSPLGSASIDFIYPFPTWEERVFDQHYLNFPAEQAIFGIYAFCVICTFLLGLLILFFRGKPTFKAAAPNVLLVMVFGTLLLMTGAVVWMMYMSTAMCYLRVWFLAIGSTLFFGALVSKTHRIYYLFLKTKLEVRGYTDTRIFLQVGVMLIYDLIVLIVWCAVQRPVAFINVVDPYRPAYNFWACTWDPMSWIMIALLGIKLVVVALYGFFLSIQLWKFGSTMFGESKETIFILYNFCVLVGLICAIEASLQMQRQTLFVVRSLIIILGALSCIFALVLPKLKGMDGSDLDRVANKIASKSSKSGVSTVTVGSAGSSSIGPGSPEYERLKAERDQLKSDHDKLQSNYEKLLRSTTN